MSRSLRERYRRLMAWFPAEWRQQGEDVVVGSLEDDADDRGLVAIPAGAAWRLRGCGIVERLAAGRTALSTAALIVAVAGSAQMFLVGPLPDVAAALSVLSALAGGPLLLASALIGMAYRGGLLTAAGTGFSLLIAGLALTGAFATRLSWSLGFDAADAGQPQPWLAAAFLPLLVTSWLLGTAGFAPLLLGLFRDIRIRPLRLLLAVGVGAAAALATGIALIWPTSCTLAAAATTVASVLQQHAAPSRTPSPAASPLLATSLWPRRARVLLECTSCVGAGIAAVFALTGSSWPGYGGDGTAAMNLGLGAAAAAAVPLLLVAGNALRTHPRHRASRAPVAIVGAAAATAAAQWIGAHSDWQSPLLVTAAACTGLGIGLLVLPFLPIRGIPAAALTIPLAAAAACTIGLPVVMLGPFAVPVLAAAVLIVTVRRARSSDPSTGPAHVGAVSG